ncbi:MAG: hypothetical protein IJ587_12300 [Synergistaceae bacterium]|nr:hypothetical protein [Synergistaceae bacterium]
MCVLMVMLATIMLPILVAFAQLPLSTKISNPTDFMSGGFLLQGLLGS